MHDTEQPFGANGTAQNAVLEKKDMPIAFFVEKNGSIVEISMAKSAVGSCCAAPDKVTKTEVMERKVANSARLRKGEHTVSTEWW